MNGTSGLPEVAVCHVEEELDKKVEQRKLVQAMEVKNAMGLALKWNSATVKNVQVIIT